MELGVARRNMGPQSTAETLAACARAAERAGLDHVWVTDHVAIPPDDAEGSGGRYLDPLATLAWLAARTERIALGTSVLILPYRPPLPTAKAVATVQELSGGRLRLGVGVGWMRAEFRALGVPREERGRRTDATLEFLRDAFANDTVEANGQPFLFKPRPAAPPIYVGGGPPYALERAARYGEGWMPIRMEPEALATAVAELRERFEAAGRGQPEVVLLTGLPLAQPDRALEQADAYREAGATQLVHGERYANAEAFAESADALGELRRELE